ncbi:MAG: hypothetical protein II730_07170 [Bacteroidales bacterium]|nr:hypothetical protein [Bacteroidales bacterium]
MNQQFIYKGFSAFINCDEDDELFVGKVTGIPDSLNFQGSSLEEAEEMFHQCIDNYLGICKETRKTPCRYEPTDQPLSQPIQASELSSDAGMAFGQETIDAFREAQNIIEGIASSKEFQSVEDLVADIMKKE